MRPIPPRRVTVTRRIRVDPPQPFETAKPPLPPQRPPLSIAAQLRTGRLADRLPLQDVAALEFPADPANRLIWRRILKVAHACGELPNPIDRVTYGTWRDRPKVRPPETALSYIGRWLDSPEPPPAPAEPPLRHQARPVSDNAILSRLQKGESIETIHRETRASKEQIRRIRDENNIAPARPGPKPKAG